MPVVLRAIGTVALIYVVVAGLWLAAAALIALFEALPLWAVLLAAGAIVLDVLLTLWPDDEWYLKDANQPTLTSLYSMRRD